MAGAGPQARELVCFVQVDPSFYVVLDAITELQDAKRLEAVGTVRVGNDGLRHAKTENIYRRDYDFSRTLGVVLRAFMLRATGLINYYDPDEKKSETVAANLTEGENGYSIEPRDPNLHLIPGDDPKGTAKEISGNFDRLYPHILIEKKLDDAELGQEVSFPGMMLIMDIDVENPNHPRIIKLHRIETTVKFTKGKGGVIKCPEPNVVYTNSNVLDGAGEDGPAFQQLMKFIKRHLGIVGQRDAAAEEPEEQAAPDAAQPEEEGQDVAQVDQGVKTLNIEAT